jgi:hypothetical protein
MTEFTQKPANEIKSIYSSDTNFSTDLTRSSSSLKKQTVIINDPANAKAPYLPKLPEKLMKMRINNNTHLISGHYVNPDYFHVSQPFYIADQLKQGTLKKFH